MARAHRSAPVTPCIRGVPILSLLAAIRALHGYDAVNRMMGRLPPELREAIRYRRVTSSEWYPLAWYGALHSTAQQATGMGRDLAKLLGRETARADFSGIYRFFLLVLSPQALIAKAPRVYAQYFNVGSLTAPEVRPGSALLVWRGCAGFDRNIWDDTTGSVEALTELTGGTNVRVTLELGGEDGDMDTDMRVAWERR